MSLTIKYHQLWSIYTYLPLHIWSLFIEVRWLSIPSFASIPIPSRHRELIQMGLPQLVATWGSMYGVMSAMEQVHGDGVVLLWQGTMSSNDYPNHDFLVDLILSFQWHLIWSVDLQPRAEHPKTCYYSLLVDVAEFAPCQDETPAFNCCLLQAAMPRFANAFIDSTGMEHVFVTRAGWWQWEELINPWGSVVTNSIIQVPEILLGKTYEQQTPVCHMILIW